MKKVLLSAVMVLLLTVFTGCNSKTTKFVVDDINTNTLYIKKDEQVKSATVEEFDKERYDIDELKTFIQSEINEYNEDVKEDAVSIDNLVLKNGNAVLVLNYTEVTEYGGFNDVKVKIYDSKDMREATFKTPVAYINIKDGSYVDSSVALEKDEYKVLILKENLDVIIEGNIMYYENATLVSNNHIQTASNGYSYIIYKPKK